MKTQSRGSILDHFRQREVHGTRCHPKYSYTNVVGNCSFFGIEDVLISTAWNPWRLQNMVLVVGPDTPADKLYGLKQDGCDSDSVSSEDSSESDDESSENDAEGGDTEMHMGFEESFFPVVHPSFHERERIHPDIQKSTKPVKENVFSSMEHSGCINTVAWLDKGWRLSRARLEDSFLNSVINSESYSSNSSFQSVNATLSEECPTQLLTSGDDTVVKIWDVGMAMASSSPIPLACTRCPFAFSNSEDETIPSLDHMYRIRFSNTEHVPGLVNMMAKVQTNHQGNVFHAIPLNAGRAGNILTCAADGSVRLCDLEYQYSSNHANLSSQVVLNDNLGMCFATEMMDQHTGLVCSEMGLQPFDLRLSAQQQSSQILLNFCRSCAIYSSSTQDSTYIFTGAGEEVKLYDMRFLSGREPKVVQRYRPRNFTSATPVFASSIDISKDRKELLVSYELDQIYTFPIFPHSHSSPTVDELFSYELQDENEPKYNSEFSSYGGHLNRDTFLKTAKYAGPKDEYICCGSDSGHAFIYDKKTSTVVSLLKADTSTCNGICSHPSLPFFITYGIDSTAKLWRATVPIDDSDDDSISGRRMRYKQKRYNASSLATRWDDVQKRLSLHKTFATEDLDVLPDNIILRHNAIFKHGLSNIMPPCVIRSMLSSNDPIQNDLMNLPKVLLHNLYEIVVNMTSDFSDDDVSVQCGFDEFRRRIHILGLNHQALELGLTVHFVQNQQLIMKPLCTHHAIEGSDLNAVDCYPYSPADWFLFDSRFSSSPIAGGVNFNKEDYREHYERFYIDKRNDIEQINVIDTNEEHDRSKTWDFLYEIVKDLKEQGNTSCKNGNIHLAASYYDKALNYCAIAYMKYPVNHLDFVMDHMRTFVKNGCRNTSWTELFKTFISIQLNLSMMHLKPELYDLKLAINHVKNVLQQLAPFVDRPGIILSGKKLKKIRTNQSEKIFQEAKEFQSKAHFRLATALAEMKEFELAIENYELCLECQKFAYPNEPTDKAILRKVAMLKSYLEKKKQKQRKKFKFSFEDALSGNDENGKG